MNTNEGEIDLKNTKEEKLRKLEISLTMTLRTK